jgi:hypothetical protein
MAKTRSRSKASQQRPKQTGSQSDHIDVFPHELRVGDHYTDDTGYQWEIAETPSALRQGKVVAVRIKSAAAAEWRQVLGGA